LRWDGGDSSDARRAGYRHCHRNQCSHRTDTYPCHDCGANGYAVSANSNAVSANSNAVSTNGNGASTDCRINNDRRGDCDGSPGADSDGVAASNRDEGDSGRSGGDRPRQDDFSFFCWLRVVPYD